MSAAGFLVAKMISATFGCLPTDKWLISIIHLSVREVKQADFEEVGALKQSELEEREKVGISRFFSYCGYWLRVVGGCSLARLQLVVEQLCLVEQLAARFYAYSLVGMVGTIKAINRCLKRLRFKRQR